jgi:hypothetical protein
MPRLSLKRRSFNPLPGPGAGVLIHATFICAFDVETAAHGAPDGNHANKAFYAATWVVGKPPDWDPPWLIGVQLFTAEVAV